MNAEKYKNVTVQLDEYLLEKVDHRATELDLNRSQYLRRLVRKDLGIRSLEVEPALPGMEKAVAA